MTSNQLQQLGFIYKKLTNKIYLCRIFANKKDHPILYHVIIPIYLKK
jgi:hypothetical protein